MHKKLISRIALLVLVLPVLVRGAEKGEQTLEQKQIKEFTKKLITGFPQNRPQIVLRKMQQKFKRQADKIKNEPIKEVKNPCPICQEELEKHPCITLHNAQEKIPHAFHAHCLYYWISSTNQTLSIPLDTPVDRSEIVALECPLCHAWDTSMPHTNPKETDEKKYTYPLKKFPINTAELQKKYLEYLENNPLSLEEYFSRGLATLPFDMALKSIEEYRQLDANGRTNMAEHIDDFDDNIQKFLLSDSFFAYKQKHPEEAKKCFELLSENISDSDTYFDLLVLQWDLLNEKQRIAYFKKTFRENSAYARTWRICNEDRFKDLVMILVYENHLNANICTQQTDDLYVANLLLCAMCANDLPANLQNYCLESILIDAKDIEDNGEALKFALGMLRAKLNKNLLDEFYKKYLAIVPLEKQIEDVGYYPEDVALQVLEKYAKLSHEDQKKFCKNDDSPGTLVQKFVFKTFLDRYGDIDIENPSETKIKLANLAFKLADQAPIFIQFAVIMSVCIDSNSFADCFEKALKHVVAIVPDKEALEDADDNDDVPSFEEIMSYKDNPIVQELMKNRTTLEERKKRWQEYIDYSKIVGLTISCLAKLPKDKQVLYLKKIADMAPTQGIKLEMQYKLFSALSPEVQISCFDEYYPTFSNNRKNKTLCRLQKQLTANTLMFAYGNQQERFSSFCKELFNNIVEQIPNKHRVDILNRVSTAKFVPFKKDSISKPLAVGGMLCSLTERLKKIHETEKLVEGIKNNKIGNYGKTAYPK